MTSNQIFAEAMKLPPKKRVEFAESLLDSVDEESDDIEFPPEFIRELERRAKEMDEHPERAIPFEVVEKELDELMRKDRRARKSR